METLSRNWKSRSAYAIYVFLGLLVGHPAFGGDESWMEDNAYRYRNNNLTTLSVPATHDTGMYTLNLGMTELGVANLSAHISLAGITLFDLPVTSGVVEAGELLNIFDQLMAVVDAVDTQCVDIPSVLHICTSFGISNAVWDWVGPYYEMATTKPSELSITQNLDLYGQLYNGARMFNLRPKVQRGEFYIHHSQGGIELGVPENFHYELDLGIDVPCIGIDYFDLCVPGTGERHSFGKFSASASIRLESMSATGPRLGDALGDIRRYLEEGHRELLVVDFSHYWKGLNGAFFTPAEASELIATVESELGPWMLTSSMLPADGSNTVEERLRHAVLPELIGDQGRVIVTFEDRDSLGDAIPDVARGFWPGGLLGGDGGWLNTNELSTLYSKQTETWISADTERFELFWTLTCPRDGFDCSVRDLAAIANPELPSFVDGLTIPNSKGNIINEIWVDFIDETAATQIAIGLNPVAVDVDLKPGNKQNNVNPRLRGGIWVAVLSDSLSPIDALQINTETVRCGPGGAAPIRKRVKDVNRDGLADLMLRFKVKDLGLECGDSTIDLKATTFDGQRLIGIDTLRTVGCERMK